MILTIDTADASKTHLSLLAEDFSIKNEIEIVTENNLSEILINKIEDFLHNLGVDKKELTLIMANEGPGTYTGLRIGLTAANLMAFSLNIPIVGYKKEELNKAGLRKIKDRIDKKNGFNKFVVPFYKMPPHITKNKYC